ncbi:MAG: hypothetical protein L0332_20345 [Chloroflexi bacterium]|nr:hypothetical protein [Chloroflexota bacterium]MCI0647566.1 hypothetical protein [Chloroflexota bacterium]MCI0729048.1 hypothetical protein [Chloroflexota bacterium]
MSPDFEWRTDEESHWEDTVAPASLGWRPAWRRWRLWLAALVLVGLATFAALRLLRQQAAQAATAVETDVLSSHHLVVEAALASDGELLNSVLSGREPAWTQSQMALLTAGLFLDRQPLGLRWQPEDAPAGAVVTLAPDLRSAEVAFRERYEFRATNGVTKTFDLEQTAVYRLSETRWLLSPPAAEFWGTPVRSNGRYLSLTFPGRDAELGHRLAADLEGVMAAFCATPALGCGPDFSLEVELATNPDILEELAAPTSWLPEEEFYVPPRLVLPAPTLVGRPVDEIGYQALLQAYARRLAAAAINQKVEWLCCRQAIFYRALLDLQLWQLGLQPWPLTRADYRRALSRPVSLGPLTDLWHSDATPAEVLAHPDAWLVYALVEFLVTERSTLPAVVMQRQLYNAENLQVWLARVTDPDETNLAFQEAWQAFVYEKVAASQGPLPEELRPEQDILLMCAEGRGGANNLYRYDLARESWSVDLADRDFVVMSGLPDGSGVALVEQFITNDQLALALWQDGREQPVITGRTFYYSTGLMDPTGRFLALAGYGPGDELAAVNLADLTTCHSLGCSLSPVNGLPIWSPGGAHTILIERYEFSSFQPETTLFRGDRLGQLVKQVGIGREPFWLDEQTYGYLRTISLLGDVVVATVWDDAPRVVLPADKLATAVPGLIDPEEWYISHATAHPSHPSLFFVTVVDIPGRQEFLVRYNWESDEATLLLTRENRTGGLLQPLFSPDGRWLVVQTDTFNDDLNQRLSDYYLYDIAQEKVTTLQIDHTTIFPIGDWTTDGQWFVQGGNGYLILTNPAAGYQYLLPHDFNDCTAIAWTK